MSIANTLTEADILSEVISPQDGDFTPEAAEAILKLHFSEPTLDRIRQMLDANNRDELSTQEKGNLDRYLRVGQLIDLLQAKARLSLKV